MLAVGKLRPHFRSACDDYLDRLRHYCDVAELELRESRASTIEQHQHLESAALAERVPAGALRVVLDRTGAAWSSEDLAPQVRRWQASGRSVACLLGGSHGMSRELVASAEAVWSLGALTLPHELARVVTLEQLYRAHTILRGEKYHK